MGNPGVAYPKSAKYNLLKSISAARGTPNFGSVFNATKLIVSYFSPLTIPSVINQIFEDGIIVPEREGAIGAQGLAGSLQGLQHRLSHFQLFQRGQGPSKRLLQHPDFYKYQAIRGSVKR